MLDAMVDPALLAPERIRPLLAREYELLVDAGAFDGERVELLRGVLVAMSPQGEPHARITAWLHSQFVRALAPERYEVRSHSPFKANEDSRPEPDVSISRPAEGGPTPANTLLLIEVAGSSLSKDRVIKTEIYAQAGVPEYWIVDLRTSSIEVLADPGPQGYTTTWCRDRGRISPRALPEVSIALAEIPWTFR